MKITGSVFRLQSLWVIPALISGCGRSQNEVINPSRSGKAPIPISGIWRLIQEIAILSLSVKVLHDIGKDFLSILFGCIITIHYILSRDRIKWLLQGE